jgi:hypothetical protein
MNEYGPGDIDESPDAIAILSDTQRQHAWNHFQALVSHVLQDTQSGAVDGKTDEDQALRRMTMMAELYGVAVKAFGTGVTFQTELDS